MTWDSLGFVKCGGCGWYGDPPMEGPDAPVCPLCGNWFFYGEEDGFEFDKHGNLIIEERIHVDHRLRTTWRAPLLRRLYLRYVEWRTYKLRSRLQWYLTGSCGNACDNVHPYGWVPEAGCPIHDDD